MQRTSMLGQQHLTQSERVYSTSWGVAAQLPRLVNSASEVLLVDRHRMQRQSYLACRGGAESWRCGHLVRMAPTLGSPRARSRGSGRADQANSSATSSRSHRRVGQVAAIAQPLSGTYEKALQDERKVQQLKQEQSTFEQAQFQDKCFFVLRVAMGVVAVLAIPAVITICSLIISICIRIRLSNGWQKAHCSPPSSDWWVTSGESL